MALMTHAAPFRKAVILCALLGLATGMTACEAPTIGETFAQLKAVDVDNGGVVSDTDPKRLRQQDVDLVIDTARNLALGEGGLLNRGESTNGQPEFAVVDPLDMPGPGAQPEQAPDPDKETVLALRAAAHDLPDVPVAVAASRPQPQPQAKAKPVTGHLIQVGSFSTTAAAQNAWRALQARHPTVAHYSPSFQPVTTAAGKSLVRLKIGPVAPEQASALCGQLGINDSWCSKAS